MRTNFYHQSRRIRTSVLQMTFRVLTLLRLPKYVLQPYRVPRQDNKPNFTKELKQSLIRENSYISEVLGIVNFPKRDDSDDEGN